VRVFLATLPPQREGPDSKGDAAPFLDLVNADIREMALDEGAVPVDLFAGMTLSDVGSDGLHPTEAGYHRMAEIWLDALRLAYEQTPEEPAPGADLSTRAEQLDAVAAAGRVPAPPASLPGDGSVGRRVER
jgi:hypothetical protein